MACDGTCSRVLEALLPRAALDQLEAFLTPLLAEAGGFVMLCTRWVPGALLVELYAVDVWMLITRCHRLLFPMWTAECLLLIAMASIELLCTRCSWPFSSGNSKRCTAGEGCGIRAAPPWMGHQVQLTIISRHACLPVCIRLRSRESAWWAVAYAELSDPPGLWWTAFCTEHT